MKQLPLSLDSREVAEMVGKRHDHLLRDIETYIEYLEESGDPKVGGTNFFISSTYISNQNKELPNYLITKKGCEFIAHKLTGQKGAIFTATYINRFHEMETIISNKTSVNLKTKEIETRLKNAKVREAKVYLQIADRIKIPEYQQIMYSKATEVLAGAPLLPLPKTEKTYSATEIGNEIGVSNKMIGRTANKHNLKTPEYGLLVWDKSPYSNKQVETWRYNENGRQKLLEIFKEV